MAEIPLLNWARQYLQDDHARFYTPGHKGGQSLLFDDLPNLDIGKWDLPELPNWAEAIATAEALAAKTFGAQRTCFLVNGSTVGVQALLMATCGEGEQVLLGRNCHRSVMAGLILSGAQPIYLPTEYDSAWQIDLGVSTATLQQYLEAYPQAKAVLITSPNYFGVCADLKKMAAIAHAKKIPLLVDSAHGTHLGFHPDLPISALQAGADGVVLSIHKTASALSQASMLNMQGQLIDQERVSHIVELLQTTSPNFLLLLSLDLARWQLVTQGQELLSQTLGLAAKLQQHSPLPVFPAGDPTRFIVSVQGLKISGFQGDRWLRENHQVICELPTLHHLGFALSMGNRASDIAKLLKGLADLKAQSFLPQTWDIPSLPPPPSSCVVNPRRAFYQASHAVGLQSAIGQISAETLCPYPPGVPVIALGEMITPEAIAYLWAIRQAGGEITGASDPSLQTIKVIKQ